MQQALGNKNTDSEYGTGARAPGLGFERFEPTPSQESPSAALSPSYSLQPGLPHGAVVKAKQGREEQYILL